MKIKRYEARDLCEALRQVKADLGAEAVVLSSRPMPARSGLWRIFKPSRVEVTAAVEEVPPKVHATAQQGRSRCLPDSASAPLSGSRRPVSRLTDGGMTAEFPKSHTLAQDLWPLYAAILEEGVDAGIAFRLLRDVDAKRSVVGRQHFDPYQALRAEMVRLVSTTGPLAISPGSPRVVALVGPTGVGKTTTIAKLAAEYAVRRGNRVVLVSLDTRRVGAVEQLRLFAQILRMPVAMARKVHDVQEVVRKNVDAELLLIDTAGGGRCDGVQLQGLRELVELEKGVDIHLVVSSTTRSRDLDAIVQEYAGLPFNKVVLTKVDECACFGEIFTLLARTRLPVSYLTTGQRVPEDIEVASPDGIVDLVIRPIQEISTAHQAVDGRESVQGLEG